MTGSTKLSCPHKDLIAVEHTEFTKEIVRVTKVLCKDCWRIINLDYALPTLEPYLIENKEAI